MTSYLTQPLARAGNLIQSTLGSVSWGPALSISKVAVESLFGRIEIGSLVIIDETTNHTTHYGQMIAKENLKGTNGVNGVNGTYKKKSPTSRVVLVVKQENFWVRLFLFADMGFAESYMLGEVECNDLTAFFEVSWRDLH